MGPRAKSISRRKLLEQMAGLSVGIPLSHAGLFPFQQKSGPKPASGSHPQQQPPQPPGQHQVPAKAPAPSTLSPEDDQFLNDLEHANFLFFWEQANPETGLI
jgi:hypothetical protein